MAVEGNGFELDQWRVVQYDRATCGLLGDVVSAPLGEEGRRNEGAANSA